MLPMLRILQLQKNSCSKDLFTSLRIAKKAQVKDDLRSLSEFRVSIYVPKAAMQARPCHNFANNHCGNNLSLIMFLYMLHCLFLNFLWSLNCGFFSFFRLPLERIILNNTL